MFEHIVLRRAEYGDPVSAGQIAEAMLYYQKVHIFIDRGTLHELVKTMGPQLLLDLLRRPDISAVYCEEFLATRTDSFGVSQRQSFVIGTLSGTEKVGMLHTPKARLAHEMGMAGLSNVDAEKFARQFLDRVPIRTFSDDYYLKGGLLNPAQDDVLDTEFAKRAIISALRVLGLEAAVPENFQFELVTTNDGFFVFTNIDFEWLNRKRSEKIPPEEPLTIANLLTDILHARADLTLASFYGGDFYTSAGVSAIIQAKHSELLRRSRLNAEEQGHFAELVLPNLPRLAEVIDSGERTFKEFLHLLDRSSRYKEWLGTANPDEGLVKAYLREVTAPDWIQSFPAKTSRYVLTLGIDALNPIVGALVGAMDNFLLERLLRGWRPNHFISEKLRPFLDGK